MCPLLRPKNTFKERTKKVDTLGFIKQSFGPFSSLMAIALYLVSQGVKGKERLDIIKNIERDCFDRCQLK